MTGATPVVLGDSSKVAIGESVAAVGNPLGELTFSMSDPVGRYHSWVVSRKDFPGCLEITAESREGQIMALRHRTYDVHGIQFHPESVLTPQGKEIIKNFLNNR